MKKKNENTNKKSFLILALFVLAGGAYLMHKKAAQPGAGTHKATQNTVSTKNIQSLPKDEGEVIATVSGEPVYKSEIMNFISAIEEKSERKLTDEEKTKMYDQVVKMRIQSKRQSAALNVLVKKHNVEQSEKFKKFEQAVQEKYASEIKNAVQKLSLVVLKGMIKENIQNTEREALDAAINKAMTVEKAIDIMVFYASDKENAERVQKALDAESVNKRQSALESIAVSQGKTKPQVRSIASFDLAESDYGKKIIAMRQGASIVLEMQNAWGVVLCLNKEPLTKQALEAHVLDQMVVDHLSEKLKEEMGKIVVKGGVQESGPKSAD